MLIPGSDYKQPDQIPTQKKPTTKTGKELHDKIAPPQTKEPFSFVKTWNYVRALKKDGTYKTAVSILGLRPSSQITNFFALRKLIQTVGLEKFKFIVSSGLDTSTIDTLTRVEEIQMRVGNENADSRINNVRMKILNSLPDFKAEQSKILTEALQQLGMDATKAKGIIEGDKNTRTEVLHELINKAKLIGYDLKGTRSISTLQELFAGGLEDKSTALTLIASQYSARDIQVKVLKEVFERVPTEDLEEAVQAHYSANESTKINIPIGTSGLAKIFFKNEKGTYEVALVYRRSDSPEGGFKIYRLLGTMGAIKDVACLELKPSTEDIASLTKEMNLWVDQQEAKVRHIPLLYSWIPSKYVFCENFPAGDVFDYIANFSTTDAQKEELFQRTAPILFEYLEDISNLGLVHRDLKPENLLISKDAKTVKVTDFGLMAKIGEDVPPGGSTDYAAPELYKGDAPDSPQDIYSAARTLMAIRYGTLEPTKRKNDAFDNLLDKMMSDTPTKRPTAQQALQEWQRIAANPKKTGWF